MSILGYASDKSLWRGIDYFERRKVITYDTADDGKITGKVEGSEDEIYSVCIDEEEPLKSTCTCPHAEGMRVVCKHKVALYLTVHPEMYKPLLEDLEEEERREMEYNYEDDIYDYVSRLSEWELRNELVMALLELEELRRNR